MAPQQAPANSAASRGSNTNSTSSTSGGSNTDNAKTSVQLYLTNCKSLYSCIYCHAHLANHDELVSRSFQGINGRAYLFNSVINVTCGPAVQRELNTGSHSVADIFCANCATTLGWKYERAYVETQKYKEGKYIIELAHVVRENRHLELDKGELFFGLQLQRGSSRNCGRSVVRRYYSPLASGDVGSPTTNGSSNEEVDEEELMFPFYDDLCAGRSSYTNNGLPSSYLNRMRRSLYLDSTPYDWKNSATSSSSSSFSTHWPTASTSTSFLAGQNQTSSSPDKIRAEPDQQTILASSLGSSNLSPSTSSSSSASTPSEDRSVTHNSLRDGRCNRPIDHGDNLRNLILELNRSAISNGDDETQFKFESEDPIIPSQWDSSVAAFTKIYVQVKQRKLLLGESGIQEDAEYGIMLQNLRDIYATLERQYQAHEPYQSIDVLREMMSTIIKNNGNDNNSSMIMTNGESNNLSQDKSMSLDDEEFFDCCTDHEVTNSASNCDSNTISSVSVGISGSKSVNTNN